MFSYYYPYLYIYIDNKIINKQECGNIQKLSHLITI